MIVLILGEVIGGAIGGIFGDDEETRQVSRRQPVEFTEEQEQFRRNIRETIGGLLQEGINRELANVLRGGFEQQQEESAEEFREDLTGELERRGIQRSGIAAESLEEFASEQAAEERQFERDLAELLINRELQRRQGAIGSGINLLGRDIEAAGGRTSQTTTRTRQAPGVATSIGRAISGSAAEGDIFGQIESDIEGIQGIFDELGF